jgi:ABC-type amino acid transport substrate-binding protein
MTKIFKKSILLLLFLNVALIANAQEQKPRDTAAPVIRVGSEKEFPPFAFIDENGEAAGLSLDLIKAVADEMGLSVVITTGSWDEMWKGLLEGRFDVLPAVAKTPERESLIDFSLPHTETFDSFFIMLASVGKGD